MLTASNAIINKIPLQKNVYNYEFSITAQQIDYILRLYYNRRISQWTLDIKDEDNNPIVMSIPLLLGAQLAKRFVNEKLIGLKYMLLSNDKSPYEEATEDSLGSNCNLYFIYELAT